MKKKTEKAIKKKVRAMLKERLQERTLRNLVDQYEKVYLCLNQGTGDEFLQQAAQEGFLIGEKVRSADQWTR